MKIVIAELESIGKDIDFSYFNELGAVTFYPDKISDENAAERLRGVEVLAINKTRIDEALLDKAPSLRLICTFATGYDNVNTSLCRERGIAVSNVVGYSTSSVAQHTFAMYFYLAEHLRHYDEFVKSGEYAAQSIFTSLIRPFHELSGMTWGIVGMGNIGKAVASIAKAYGARVIFYSSSGKSSVKEYERVELNELLKRSDVLSLHCPLTDSTRGLINAEALGNMKSSAYLINVARGPVVDETALYNALLNNEIAGAALDVLSAEPMEADSPLAKIKDSSRLLITPHMAWASIEARNRCTREVYENIKAFMRGEHRNQVN